MRCPLWIVGLLLLLAWGGGTALQGATAPASAPAPTAPVPTPTVSPAPAKEEAPAEPEADTPFARAYREAFVAFKSKDYPHADAAIDEAIKLAPGDARAPILKGRIAAAKEETAPAEGWIKKGLALQPGSTVGHRALGDLYFKERLFDPARLAYLDAQRYGDADPDLSLLIFYCDIGQRDLADAEKRDATFNAFDEKTPRYYFAKAALARMKGDNDVSRQALQDATVLYGNEVFAQYAVDYFFLFSGKP